MPTRYWERGSVFQDGTGPLPYDLATGCINLIEIPGAATPTTTMVRVLLDFSISVTLPVPAGNPAWPGWWLRCNSVVVGGLYDNASASFPSTLDTEDANVTLTAGITGRGGPDNGTPSTATCVIDNPYVLESKGERKLPSAVGMPVFRASVDITSVVDNIPGRTNFTRWQVWAYARVLWQDP